MYRVAVFCWILTAEPRVVEQETSEVKTGVGTLETRQGLVEETNRLERRVSASAKDQSFRVARFVQLGRDLPSHGSGLQIHN